LSSLTTPEGLRELARINRLANKNALADTLEATADKLQIAEDLVRTFPTLIFPKPGARAIVGAGETSEYAHRLGEWTRKRDTFLQKGARR
jgi:hypothetical protein